MKEILASSSSSSSVMSSSNKKTGKTGNGVLRASISPVLSSRRKSLLNQNIEIFSFSSYQKVLHDIPLTAMIGNNCYIEHV